VANAGVANFYHFLFANRVYEVNGSHPLPGADKVDFTGFAAAAGYREAQDFDNLNSFSNALPSLLTAQGPQFATLNIVAGKSYPRDYNYIHSNAARESFRQALTQR
jgi:hypothetical protein